MTEVEVIPERERDPWYPGGQRDATVWVEEFFRIYPKGKVDADTMLGWFANAIETGAMFGSKELAGGSLDAAWAECEAALPEGWSFLVWRTMSENRLGYGIEAQLDYGTGEDRDHRVEFVHGPTFTEALTRLTTLLRDRTP